MAKGRLDSQWWQTSWIVAAVRNSVQTERSALVTPADINPMVDRKTERQSGLVVRGTEFEMAFRAQVMRQKGG